MKLSLLLITISCFAQEFPKALVSISGAPSRETAPHVLRSRAVEINVGLFDEVAAQSFNQTRKKTVSFDFFDNVRVVVEVTSVRLVPGKIPMLIWNGSVKGSPLGKMSLVVTGSMWAARVSSIDGRLAYTITQMSGIVHWIDECAFDRLPKGGSIIRERGVQAPADGEGPTVNVVVVYTSAAKAFLGGYSQMSAAIALAISDMNDSYAASGVLQRVALVAAVETSFIESGSLATDFASLVHHATSRVLGEQTPIKDVRDRNNADLVGYIVGVIDADLCGQGSQFASASTALNFYNSATSVTNVSCLPNWTLSHEMGHNMGANHNIEDQPSPGRFSYSKGYRQNTSSPEFRTIMAYDFASGTSAPRINVWSSPLHTYAGLITGTSTIDNARTLNNTASIVIRFRASKTLRPSQRPIVRGF